MPKAAPPHLPPLYSRLLLPVSIVAFVEAVFLVS